MPVDRRRTLTFVPVAPDVPPDDSTIVIVLDSTWTASGDLAGSGSVIGIRGIGGRLLAERDLISETSARLDAWATTSGDRRPADRRRHVDVVLRPAVRVGLAPATDPVDDPGRRTRAGAPAGADHLRARDRRRGRGGRQPDRGPGWTGDRRAGADARGHARTGEPPPPTAAWPTRIARRLRGRLRRLLGGGSPAGSPDVAARRRAMQERLDGLCREPGRLLVVLEHARQRVETADGARDLNPYLSPVVDALRGTPLDPIEIDLKARVDDETWWARLDSPDGARLLPGSVTAHAGAGEGDRPAAGSVDGCGLGRHGPGRHHAARGVRRGPRARARRAGGRAGGPMDAGEGALDRQHPRRAAPPATGRDPARGRIPPPGLAHGRARRGGLGRSHPARHDLRRPQRLHAPRSSCGAGAPGPDLCLRGLGTGPPAGAQHLSGGRGHRVGLATPRSRGAGPGRGCRRPPRGTRGPPRRSAGRPVRHVRAGLSAIPHPVCPRPAPRPPVAGGPPRRETASGRAGPRSVRGPDRAVSRPREGSNRRR